MQKKIPQRQCMGCRERKNKRELIRVVRSPEGQVSLDFGGKMNGRGAYLCPDPECLKRAIRSSSRTGHIPAFVHLDLNEICGGVYEWRAVKETIIRECGWVPPVETGKGLHTSCRIEKCKEHVQFARFYRMESAMIPFSALELAIASRDRNQTREEALAELNNSLGFSLEEIPECAIMKEYLRL